MRLLGAVESADGGGMLPVNDGMWVFQTPVDVGLRSGPPGPESGLGRARVSFVRRRFLSGGLLAMLVGVKPVASVSGWSFGVWSPSGDDPESLSQGVAWLSNWTR